jgi:chromosome segregation ATPase
VKKGEFESLLDRIEKLEKETKEHDKNIKRQSGKHKKWKPRWIQMQKDIEELKKLIKNTVDRGTFDEEIERLKDLINQLASSGKEIKAPLIQSGPSISSKDLADLRELVKKVAEHEDKIGGLNINIEQIIKKIGLLTDEVAKKADSVTVNAELKKHSQSI